MNCFDIYTHNQLMLFKTDLFKYNKTGWNIPLEGHVELGTG